MSKSLIDGVSDWLDQGGYPLELYVAKTLRKLKYFCTKSPLFTDIESNKPREIDLVASYSFSNQLEQVLDIKLVIECKKSSKAFVVLCDNPRQTPVIRAVVFGNLWAKYRDDVLVSMTLHSGGSFRRFRTPSLNDNCREGYSLVQAYQQSSTEVYAEIYKISKAWQYEMERTLSERDNYIRDSKTSNLDREEFQKLFFIHVPLLVVDAPLVEVFLDDSGNTTIEEKSIASVRIRRPWEPQDIKSVDDFGLSVLIVTKARFAEVARDFKTLAKQMVNLQTESTRKWMLQMAPKPVRKSKSPKTR